jgi:hypothetical protein
MTEKRPHHYGWNEIKTDILKFLLKNENSVSEPTIRQYLKEKYGVVDQGTVNTHLKKLNELGSIEKVTPTKKTRSNYFDVQTMDNLRNINSEFPKVSLLSFDKSIKICLEELVGEGLIESLDCLEAKRFTIQFSVSKEYFDAFLKNGFRKLYSNAFKINPFSGDVIKTKRYVEMIDEIYADVIEPIVINQNIRLSKVEFEEIVRFLQYYEGYELRTNHFFANAVILKLRDKFINPIPVESVGIENRKVENINLDTIEAEIKDKVHSQTNKYREKVNKYLGPLLIIRDISTKSTQDIIFTHFYERDVLNGIGSDAELLLVSGTKRILESFKGNEQKLNDDLLKLYETVKKRQKKHTQLPEPEILSEK